jgi:hypothetical protein
MPQHQKRQNKVKKAPLYNHKGDIEKTAWRQFKSDSKHLPTLRWRGIKKETLINTGLAVARVNPQPQRAGGRPQTLTIIGLAGAKKRKKRRVRKSRVLNRTKFMPNGHGEENNTKNLSPFLTTEGWRRGE